MNGDIVRVLTEARRSGAKAEAYPGPKPANRAAAYAVQGAVKAALGWRQIGWKCGCTSERAQKALGTDGPFAGPVYAERCFASGAHVPTDLTNARTSEPEIGFTMDRDLPARGKPYEIDEVLAAVRSVHASLEVVNPRLPNGFADPVEWYIADGALNDALVFGPAHKPLPRADYARIANEAFVNGVSAGPGVGANALGGPERVLTWLANELNSIGTHLKAGDVVSTGVITEIFHGKHGDEVRAVYDRLGEVSLRY